MLENLYNQINEGLEEYKTAKAEKEQEINQMKESGQYAEDFIEEKEAELQQKAESNLDSKVAAAFNDLEVKAEEKVNKLQQELEPEVDYSEKTYKSTKAANIINMLEPEQVPDYINQISDKLEREEFTKLAKIKLSGKAKLQRKLNNNLLNSLGQEELEARQELAYNRELLNNADSFLKRTSQMLDKIAANKDQQNYFIDEKVNNLNNYLGDKNEKIKQNLNIVDQF